MTERSHKPTRLVWPRARVDARLEELIASGEELVDREITSEEQEQLSFRTEQIEWRSGIQSLTQQAFNTNDEYRRFGELGYSYQEKDYGRRGATPEWLVEGLKERDWVRKQLDYLKGLKVRVGDMPDPIDVRPGVEVVGEQVFEFMSDPAIRAAVVADVREAEASLRAGAPKAAAILASTAVEGIFLDVLQRSEVVARPNYESSVKVLKLGGPDIRWDRASLVTLADAAARLGVLDLTRVKLIQGVGDYRDTVHTYREIERGRPDEPTAHALLSLIPVIAADLARLLLDQ